MYDSSFSGHLRDGCKVGMHFPDPNIGESEATKPTSSSSLQGHIKVVDDDNDEDDLLYMHDIESSLNQLRSFNLVK